jgi:hypothetical protein
VQPPLFLRDPPQADEKLVVEIEGVEPLHEERVFTGELELQLIQPQTAPGSRTL